MFEHDLFSYFVGGGAALRPLDIAAIVTAVDDFGCTAIVCSGFPRLYCEGMCLVAGVP
ncbi:protein of unknown function (plasmid) [Caballeronia sp. S22]